VLDKPIGYSGMRKQLPARITFQMAYRKYKKTRELAPAKSSGFGPELLI
jgi:hypothetical protein